MCSKECVKRRALKSLQLNPNCSGAAAKDAIEAVWDICYNDTYPFERAPWFISDVEVPEITVANKVWNRRTACSFRSRFLLVLIIQGGLSAKIFVLFCFLTVETNLSLVCYLTTIFCANKVQFCALNWVMILGNLFLLLQYWDANYKFLFNPIVILGA